MNGTGTVIPLPLPYLYRTFVDVFLTHTVYIYMYSMCQKSGKRYGKGNGTTVQEPFKVTGM